MDTVKAQGEIFHQELRALQALNVSFTVRMDTVRAGELWSRGLANRSFY